MTDGARDWDNFRLLLALARTGSLRAAALESGVALNTLRTRIAALEASYGEPLVARSVGGSTMTELGQRVVALAEEVRSIVDKAASLRA